MEASEAASVPHETEPSVIVSAIERAVSAVGGLGKLASACNVKYQAVQRWLSTGKVPAERVLSVESASGVHRSELRPDLYPPADFARHAPQVQSGADCTQG
jgi:DNA-binding transcriptional regulator YdaS (Cro superfamily)